MLPLKKKKKGNREKGEGFLRSSPWNPILCCELALFLQSAVFIDVIMQQVFECLYWSLTCQLREKDVDIAFAQDAIDEYKVEL